MSDDLALYGLRMYIAKSLAFDFKKFYPGILPPAGKINFRGGLVLKKLPGLCCMITM